MPVEVEVELSFVVPVFNEAESLRELTDQIAAAVAPLHKSWELIFVDDGSTDESWTTVGKLVAERPNVRGLKFRRNFGKAAALQAGFGVARAAVVFTLDADLQDDPVEIPRFLVALNAGLDVVSGWKQVRHDPWHKVFPSRVFNGMISRLTGVTLHDHNCGYKAYRRDVIREVRLYGELHRFVPVLAAARGYRVGEMAVHHRPRKFGRSKFGWQRFLKGFLDLLHVRFVTGYGRRPMHFFGTTSVILFALALLLILTGSVLSLATNAGLLTVLAFVLGSVALTTSVQALFVGYLAELFVSRSTTDRDTFEISLRLGLEDRS